MSGGESGGVVIGGAVGCFLLVFTFCASICLISSSNALKTLSRILYHVSCCRVRMVLVFRWLNAHDWTL